MRRNAVCSSMDGIGRVHYRQHIVFSANSGEEIDVVVGSHKSVTAQNGARRIDSGHQCVWAAKLVAARATREVKPWARLIQGACQSKYAGYAGINTFLSDRH